ncbi:MAG: prepilin-type N-terminal cleavage/methylation domain-containing protein [Subdoligranulum variabile]|nr:prepilin-type N-terminal cleavage/methylation domain-containing protein [Subdoligranulum variabile]
MMRVLKNKRGTTLVELVVCMVLLSLFTLAAVTLIQPSAQAYMQVQQQTRAQNLADALIETIRGELLNANGYIRFADGATDNNFDTVFDKKSGVSSGTALEFSVYPNHIELIDKDKVPALTKADGTQLLSEETANELDGYLHMRFYQQEEVKSAKSNPPSYVPYAYTTAYPKDAYMGMFISNLQFYARSYTKAEGEKYAHVTALTVVLTVAQKDAQGKAVPLCTQKAIVPLPGAPVYIEEPGDWDGSNPAVS